MLQRPRDPRGEAEAEEVSPGLSHPGGSPEAELALSGDRNGSEETRPANLLKYDKLLSSTNVLGHIPNYPGTCVTPGPHRTHLVDLSKSSLGRHICRNHVHPGTALVSLESACHSAWVTVSTH